LRLPQLLRSISQGHAAVTRLEAIEAHLKRPASKHGIITKSLRPRGPRVDGTGERLLAARIAYLLGLSYSNALPTTILVSVLGGALVYVGVGLAIGLVTAWGLAQFVRGFLFEIQAHDPTIYAGALMVLAMTGLTAAFVPARRAAGVDPLVALRME
jgi:hypothetical protein